MGRRINEITDRCEMENSEIRRSSVENPEGLRKDGVDLEKSQLQQEKTGNSRSKTREMEDTPRKTRVKSAKREGRKEVRPRGNKWKLLWYQSLRFCGGFGGGGEGGREGELLTGNIKLQLD